MKKDFSSFNLNNTFKSADKNVEQACAGDYYYNAVLEANTSVNLINTITPAIDSSLLGQTLRLKIQAEVVNYIGGPYYTWRDLPWKDFPPAWFVNQSYITKVDGSTVTPRISGTWNDFSKIELTARIDKSTYSGVSSYANYVRLFCLRNDSTAYPSLCLGTSGNNWEVNYNTMTGGWHSYPQGLTSFSASLTPAQFIDGNWHTILFSWNGSLYEGGLDNNFISLTWDNAWSKETSYKQIKFYDTNGKLVYDLRPDDRTGTNTGKFYNYLDGTVLDMYTDGKTSATVTNSVYATSDNALTKVVNIGWTLYDIEEMAVSWKKSWLTIEQDETGNKYFKGEAHSSPDGYNEILFAIPNGVVGQKYNISFKFKTNIPRDLFYINYTYRNTGYYSAQLFTYMNSALVPIYDGYSFSGDWELISVDFTATVNQTLWLCIGRPGGGSDYYIAIDDVIVHKL